MNSTILYLYTANVIFSLSSIICMFIYYTIDYSLIPLANSYYFYCFTAILSLMYGTFETCLLYQYNSLPILRERYAYFPYFLFISGVFLNISWFVSSIFSSFILRECSVNYDNCDTIIALTSFGFLEFIIWSSVCFLLIYKNVTVREPEQSPSSSPSPSSLSSHEIIMRDSRQQRLQICHPPSVESHRAEVLEMEEINL